MWRPPSIVAPEGTITQRPLSEARLGSLEIRRLPFGRAVSVSGTVMLTGSLPPSRMAEPEV